MTTASSLAAQGTTIAISTVGSPEMFHNIAEVRQFTGPGGSAKVIDTTTLDSTRKEYRIGLPDEGTLSLDLNFDPKDTNGQIAAMTARANRTEEHFKITYSDGSYDKFHGYVMEFQKSGAVDGNLEAKMTIQITGAVTFTAAA